MVNKKTFINPLTHSSEGELHVPKPASETSPYPDDPQQPSAVNPFQPVRKRGNQAFEKTHQRFTGQCTTVPGTFFWGTRHMSSSSSLKQWSAKPSSIAGEFFLYFTSK